MTTESTSTDESASVGRKLLLLVEDNLAANLALARFLEARGYRVSAVTNGQEAIELMRRETPFEIVLTDLQLPDLDGKEVAEFAFGLHPRPRIVAVTGWDVDPESDPRLAEMTDWILLKPLDLADLLRRLERSGSGESG